MPSNGTTVLVRSPNGDPDPQSGDTHSEACAAQALNVVVVVPQR